MNKVSQVNYNELHDKLGGAKDADEQTPTDEETGQVRMDLRPTAVQHQ
jgi:hypothetical protein